MACSTLIGLLITSISKLSLKLLDDQTNVPKWILFYGFLGIIFTHQCIVFFGPEHVFWPHFLCIIFLDGSSNDQLLTIHWQISWLLLPEPGLVPQSLYSYQCYVSPSPLPSAITLYWHPSLVMDQSTVAQMAERAPWIQKIPSSNPASGSHDFVIQ